ncbi:hypothetical protein R3P38DRAFT_2545985, partial [Favolaschia claudopus]
GHFIQRASIFTVYCGNTQFMKELPLREEHPGFDPTSEDPEGEFRRISWIHPAMPYLMFLPAQDPFEGPLFQCLSVTAHHGRSSHQQPLPIWHSTMITKTSGQWANLEYKMHEVLVAMRREFPDHKQLLKGFLFAKLPSKHGFHKTFESIPDLTKAIRHARDAFLPLMAAITMMFVLLDARDADGSWRHRVMAAAQVPPQWFADLESSAVGNMKIKRLVNRLLDAVIGKLDLPLYFHWGAIEEKPSFPIPTALQDKGFYPDRNEIKWLQGQQDNTGFSYREWGGGLGDSPKARGDDDAVMSAAPIHTTISTPSTGPVPEPANSLLPEQESTPALDEGIHVLLSRRQCLLKQRLATEIPENRAIRLAREATAVNGEPPGMGGAKVFVWEERQDFAGGFIRRAVNRSTAADLWNDFAPTQRIFDSWANEWDLCIALDPMASARPVSQHSEHSDHHENSPVSAEVTEASPSTIVSAIMNLPSPSDVWAAPAAPETPEVHIHESSGLSPDMVLLPDEPIDMESTAASLLAVYRSYDTESTSVLNSDDLPKIEEVIRARFGFTGPSSPSQYAQCLRNDVYGRSIGDETWVGLKKPGFALLPTLLAFILDAKKLADVPEELLDLRQETADIACSDWAVDINRKVFDKTPFYILHPQAKNSDPKLHIILHSAVAALQVIRMGWGFSSVDEIAYHLRLLGIEYYVCTTGPPVCKPHPQVFRTGLAYKARRIQFMNSSRGRFARCAGGIVGRLARDHDDDLTQGPSEAVFHTGRRFWDGNSEMAFWADTLTREEIDLICGVYFVNTGSKHSGEADGLQKKAVSWWPTPAAYSGSGMNIGWWSPCCESWYQKRVADIEENGELEVYTRKEWRDKIKFVQKSRHVHVANEKISAEYLLKRLVK